MKVRKQASKATRTRHPARLHGRLLSIRVRMEHRSPEPAAARNAGGTDCDETRQRAHVREDHCPGPFEPVRWCHAAGVTEDRHARRPGSFDTVAAIFHDGASCGRHAQARRRMEKQVGCRLSIGDFAGTENAPSNRS